jgi:hypothetical protein
VRPEEPREGHRDRGHKGESDQRLPGLIAVAQGQPGQPRPGQVGAGQRPAIDLGFPLGDQDLADLTVVACGAVRGRELLVRLRRVRLGAPAQSVQPVVDFQRKPGAVQRKPGLGQPVQGQPSLGISRVLQPRRLKHQHTTDLHVQQVEGLVLVRADGLEPVAEEDAQVGLQAIGVQGGTSVIAHRRIVAPQLAEVGTSQLDCARPAGTLITARSRTSPAVVSRWASRGDSAGCSSRHSDRASPGSIASPELCWPCLS